MLKYGFLLISVFAFTNIASAENYYQRSERFAGQAPKVGPSCEEHIQLLNETQLQHVARFGESRGGYTITDKEWSARHLKSVLFTTADHLSCRTRPGWAIIDCIDLKGVNIADQDRDRPTLGANCSLYYSKLRRSFYPRY